LVSAENGQYKGEVISFSSVGIDTIALNRGDLYIALKGEHFDGHQFIRKAVESGCSGFVISSHSGVLESDLEQVPHIAVENTLKALGDCARLNREAFQGKVVGLTGSSGKISTKNMLECILSEKG